MTWAATSFTPGGADPRCARIIERAGRAGLSVATAESLTGGALVSALVDVPGASTCIAGGAVCYSLDAKARLLGVDAGLLARTGAVTEEVAQAMARGARTLYAAEIAVATTGVAGPGPDERGVAAGTVHLALALADPSAAEGERVITRTLALEGDRSEVRHGAVQAALSLLDSVLDERARA